MNLVFFFAGLGLLVLGAELLVRGASRLALAVGLSPLVVGLTVVAMGTSAPEVAVAVGAVMGGQSDIAIGNVVGSNIFNVLLILGLSALIVPLVVHSQIIRQEVPIMIAISLLLVVMVQDRVIGMYEGGLLVALLVAYTWFIVAQSRRATRAAAVEVDMPEPEAGSDGWVELAPGTSRARRGRSGLPCHRIAASGDGLDRLCPDAGGQRTGDRPDHCRRRHFAARGCHLDNRRDERRA